jgi:glutaredoxin
MNESEQVILYVVPGCPLCENARQLLSELGTTFVERDVANEYSALRAMYKRTRQGLVPVVEHNGKALVRPTREELAALFGA